MNKSEMKKKFIEAGAEQMWIQFYDFDYFTDEKVLEDLRLRANAYIGAGDATPLEKKLIEVVGDIEFSEGDE